MRLNMVYNMDCCDGFLRLQEEGIKADLVFADPPYFLDRSKTIKFKTRKNINAPISWDIFKDEDEYLKWTRDWLRLAASILSPTGQLLCYCRVEYISNIIATIKDLLIHKCTLYYVKTNPPPSVRKKNYVSSVETILWFVKNPTKYTFNFQTQKEMRNAFITSIPSGKVRKEFPHPTMKPLALSELLVKVHSNEGDLIVVPFAGVGTECLAARRLGRNFIGFEIDPYYYELCLKRLGITKGVDDLERKNSPSNKEYEIREASIG